MIYLFGNCQTGFLCDALCALGVPATSRQLASPLTYVQSPGQVDAELAAMAQEHQVEDFFHLRSLFNQMVLLDASDQPPDLAVFSMFHEPGPLFLHKDKDFSFFIDPAVMEARPLFGDYLRKYYRSIGLNPTTYFQRFGQMVERFRVDHPAIPLLILTRLSHFPGFGPRPWSYLECWDMAWQDAVQALEPFAASLDQCRVLNLDQVFASIWNSLGQTCIEAHCPFLRFTESGVATPFHPEPVRRDVEHVGSMWPVLAEIVAQYARTGVLHLPGDTSLPHAWGSEHRPERMGVDAMQEHLASGANYRFARAVSAMFQHQGCDLTPLLAKSVPLAPVCHNTLHMLRRYGTLFPTPFFMEFLRIHRRSALAFSANGEAYQERYVERLDAMESETRARIQAI